MRGRIEVSPGEIADRLTILQIKAGRISDPDKLGAILREKAILEDAWSRMPDSVALRALVGELKSINEQLWELEDLVRAHERAQDFGPSFVQRARAIYKTNDRRAYVKRRINEALGSDLLEVKAYTLAEADR